MKTQKYRFTPKERLKIYKDLRKRLVAYGNNEGFTGFMCLILSKYMGIKLYRYNGSLPFLPELNEHRPHKGINDVYAWFPEKNVRKTHSNRRQSDSKSFEIAIMLFSTKLSAESKLKN